MRTRKGGTSADVPGNILKSGLRTLGDIGSNVSAKVYSKLKSEAKGKARTIFVGEKMLEKVVFQLFEYDMESYAENHQLADFKFFNNLDPNKSYWLNFHGLHEVDLYEDLAKTICLDRLTVRQMLDTTQRPKVEEYDTYLFFSVKSILGIERGSMYIEQISFILTSNYVISFQEKPGDHFGHIRSKVRDKLGLVRHKSIDFLLVQLLDAVLDNYFETIDSINLQVGELEKTTLKDPKQSTLWQLEKHKKNTLLIKKSLMPFREALSNILNGKTRFIRSENEKYFHDLLNGCKNAMDEVESTYRNLESLTNIYFATLTHKGNETMKVLTTVATVFIPLTFIVGVYGMNFDNMPELHYRYGYFIIWGLMIAATLGMLLYFKLKKWL